MSSVRITEHGSGVISVASVPAFGNRKYVLVTPRYVRVEVKPMYGPREVVVVTPHKVYTKLSRVYGTYA